MLDDATKDVRTPTHDVAPDVLKSRRRINTQPPGLSAAGLRSLRGRDFVSGSPAASSAADGTVEVTTDPDVDRSTGGGDESNGDVSGSAPSSSPSTRCWPDPMRPIEQATRPGWPALGNEICSSTISTGRGRAAGRMARGAAAGARPAARAAGNVALDAWNVLSVLQHAPWLGRVLAASILRQAGVTASAHLAAINLGLETMPVERRRHRDRNFRLLALPMG